MDTPRALSPVLSRLIRDLHSFLRLLDHENLSNIAQAQRKSLWELLSQIPHHQPAVSVEDAEYMVMSCPSSSPTNQLTSPAAAGEFLMEPAWDRVGNRETQTGSEPAGEDEEDTYEEAEPYVGHAITTAEGAQAECSVYESYGEEEEEEEQVKDRAHYICWRASQPCLRPLAEWRLCAYLWRRRWLQWSKEWFLIQRDMLLCYRCARDLLPQLELNLRGCRLVLKSSTNKKIPQQLKLTLSGPPVQILVLGFSSFQQAEEWRRVLQEVSAGADAGSGTASTSSRSGSLQSDSEEDRFSSHSGPHCQKNLDPDGPDVLNVLMSYQWQSLRCRVEPGRLSMYATAVGEEAGRAQYTIQLRGCHITAGPDNKRPYRITLSTLGDTVAVLEAASPEQMQRWLQRLLEGADDVTPRGLPEDQDLQSRPGQDLPVYYNACQDSGPARCGSTADCATYSNAVLSGGGTAQVGRSVQKLELTRRTEVKRAGSEVNLSAGKRTSFRQSLSVCSERAQMVLLSPLLRRTSSLRRAPSLLLEHGTVIQKRRAWERRATAGP
ncbi:actin filament-associated protein 1-like 1 isoform X1 [Synchiropus splendidus]|uniref:actin filament-associated protein 1-like 1 isoform X1 n=1 Tax=Synchiropus splendidus TaxID=270530 RepID=UPI00237D87C1|nr:actin filament-associated protein 1-like 1 isoform X1 [Synchiropus splendidus]